MDFFVEICLFLTFFAGMGFAACLSWLINRKALSIVRGQAGVKGRQAQQEQEVGLMALATEVITGFQQAKAEGKPLKDVAMPILTAAAANHPAAAMKLAGKLGKQFLGGKGGGLGALGELLE